LLFHLKILKLEKELKKYEKKS